MTVGAPAGAAPGNRNGGPRKRLPLIPLMICGLGSFGRSAKMALRPVPGPEIGSALAASAIPLISLMFRWSASFGPKWVAAMADGERTLQGSADESAGAGAGDAAGGIAAPAPAPAELIARARALVPALASGSLEGRRRRSIAHETIAEMQRAGLFRVLQPRRWAGYEMDLETFYEIELALGALQGMLAALLDYGRTRVTRAGGRSSENPFVQLLCAETAAAIDEMTAVLHRNFRNLHGYAQRGETPPLEERLRYKFQSTAVTERCTLLAARIFKATGAAGLSDDLRFGGILADLMAGRAHISNQHEHVGTSYGGVLFGLESNDLML